MPDPVYLDHHATTPCDPRVLERMLPYFTEHFGNPASISHSHGRKAATAVEEARATVAAFFGVRPPEVFFTAGATESNNLAIRGLRAKGRHWITTAVEHKSVLVPMSMRQAAGHEVTLLQPDREGFVTASQVAEAIRPDTALVSVIAANGEIGTIEPIAEIAAVCRERGVPFHTDATQAAGKIPFDAGELGCDLVSLSAHKLYGPKGVGALIARRGLGLDPILAGGGQEKGVRSGTVNVPGVIGLAAALELRAEDMQDEAQRLTALRNGLWDRLIMEIPRASVHGPRELRLPGNLNIGFEGVDAEGLMFALRRFSISAGSACSSGEREPSSVLRAIGLDDREAHGSIRIGMGRATSSEEIDLLVEDLKRAVARLRSMSAGSEESA